MRVFLRRPGEGPGRPGFGRKGGEARVTNAVHFGPSREPLDGGASDGSDSFKSRACYVHVQYPARHPAARSAHPRRALSRSVHPPHSLRVKSRRGIEPRRADHGGFDIFLLLRARIDARTPKACPAPTRRQTDNS